MYTEISQDAIKLNMHPLMKYFRDKGSMTTYSFAFAPKMAFFVLGFKDILAAARTAHPKNALEESLNNHCEEDADHWEWFLEDLTTLGKLKLISGVNECTPSIFLADIWSSQSYVVRSFTYEVITLLSGEKSAEEKLVIIECLEAAFSVFITNLTHMTQRAGIYNSLRYFGREHHIDEAQHAMGSWLDGKKESQASEAVDGETSLIINNIFLRFSDMFDYWLSSVEISEQEAASYAAPRELDLV